MAATFGVFGSYAVVEEGARGGLPESDKRPRPSRPIARSARGVLAAAQRLPPVVAHLEHPCPYGVRPEGCMLLEGARESSRAHGLGLFSALPDDLILHVLSWCTECDLCVLSVASRAAYVFSHASDLWRSHALSRARARAEGAWAFGASWKGACMAVAARDTGGGAMSDAKTVAPACVHAPVACTGVYSDLLFKAAVASGAALSPAWSAEASLARVPACAMTPSAFAAAFEATSTPAVIVGGAARWRACGGSSGVAWTPTLLAAAPTTGRFHCGGVDMELRDYMAYSAAVSGRDDRPLYLFERNFASLAPGLAADIGAPPPPFADDLSALLPPDLRPDHTWLIAGPKKSGSTFHKDPNSSSAWNALIYGAKAWILYPPSLVPPGVIVSSDGGDVATPVSVMEWYLDHFDAHVSKLPGDVVFIPAGWWHQVLNLDDSVAVTHNFVSCANLAGVLELWRDEPSAISGVPSGAAPRMFDAFVSVLEAERPEALTLARAQLADRDAQAARAQRAEEEAAMVASTSAAESRRSKCSQWRALVSGAVGKDSSSSDAAPFSFTKLWAGREGDAS